MAGLIVGFDSDDVSIFDEQFRFIQEARIPVSTTGLLNGLPRTPLYERLRRTGRLVAESVGDQFVFTNVVPLGMSRLELYDGYKLLLERLYDYGAYRRRAIDLILHRGGRTRRSLLAGPEDVWIFARFVWSAAGHSAAVSRCRAPTRTAAERSRTTSSLTSSSSPSGTRPSSWMP